MWEEWNQGRMVGLPTGCQHTLSPSLHSYRDPHITSAAPYLPLMSLLGNQS